MAASQQPEDTKKIKVLMLLLGPGTIGGTERRIISATPFLNQIHSAEILLAINQELLSSVREGGLEPKCNFIELNSFFRKVRRVNTLPVFNGFRKALRLFLSSVNYLYLSFQFFRLLWNYRPDIVQLVLDSARIVYLPFLIINRSALVINLVGSETRDYHLGKLIDKKALKWSMHKADVVEAISDEIKARAIQQQLVAEEKIVVAGSFIESDKYLPSADKKPWVVFAARLIPEKNPLLFLDAIPQVLSSLGNSIQFYLLGDGPLLDTIKTRILELGIERNVTLGFHPNVQEILAESMVFCSLQQQENYPSRSLLEAMSCGNAVVATDVGYTYLLVTPNTGYRIPFDATALSETLIRMLSDRQRTLEVGRNSRALVVKSYSPQQYCEKLSDLYQIANQMKSM